MKNIRARVTSSIVIILLGIVFAISAGFAFVNTELGRSYIVRNNATSVSRNLTAKQADKNNQEKASYDATKTRSITPKTLWAARKSPAKPIGRMSIPAVNIHNPVFKGFGLSNQNLSYGVATVLPDREMGLVNNYVLAGHYMGQYGPAILDNLHKTKKGDWVYVTNMHRIYAYRINHYQPAVDPHDVQVEDNQPGKRMITLITCSDFNIARYGYGKHRTIVQGELKAVYPATKENLARYELTDDVIPKHVRPAAKGSFLQNLTLHQIEAAFAIVWVLVIAAALNKVWRHR